MVNESYVVVDVETYHPGGVVGINNAQLRYVGFRHHGGKNVCYHYPTDKDKIQKVLDFFPYIVNHNLIDFDKPILELHGFRLDNKVLIDTYVISENRLKQMLYIDLNQGDRSLKKLCERFNLHHKKGEFDYDLLEKTSLGEEEYLLLESYLFSDLEATDDLFKYYYELFYPFREYMTEKNQNRMSWLTCSSGSTAYKCITAMAGLPEEYEDMDGKNTGDSYAGGYVSEPFTDFVEGDLYCADFASLYPSMMIGFNLFSPAETDWFMGSEIYPSMYGNDEDGIRGRYSRKNGPVEKTVKDLYEKKLSLDNRLANSKDEEEKAQLSKERLVIKILVNTIYGICGSPVFKSVYNRTAASDCTALARRSIKHARLCLEERGYVVYYSDTDSCYFLDPHKNHKRVTETLDWISSWQRGSMNLINSYHKFVLECRIKRIYFFHDDKGSYVKKKYIYVTDEGKIKEKGLTIVKGNCSKIAKEFYLTIIKNKIKDNTFKLYDPEVMLKELKLFSVGKEQMLQKRYRVGQPESYKVPDGKEESTTLNYSIAVRYGAGEHFLVVNKRIGVGKGNKYCKIGELKDKYGVGWVDQICFELLMNDLAEFIEWKLRNKTHKADRKRIVN